jgi:hypothetical protein
MTWQKWRWSWLLLAMGWGLGIWLSAELTESVLSARNIAAFQIPILENALAYSVMAAVVYALLLALCARKAFCLCLCAGVVVFIWERLLFPMSFPSVSLSHVGATPDQMLRAPSLLLGILFGACAGALPFCGRRSDSHGHRGKSVQPDVSDGVIWPPPIDGP